MDADLLRDAGIEDADAVIVATDGDNTNIIIGQVAQKRFEVSIALSSACSIRARAKFYSERGLDVVCPTTVGDRPSDGSRPHVRDSRRGRRLMYVIVAGGGKVGANVARSLHAARQRGDTGRAAP